MEFPESLEGYGQIDAWGGSGGVGEGRLAYHASRAGSGTLARGRRQRSVPRAGLAVGRQGLPTGRAGAGMGVCMGVGGFLTEA